jgi:hypothetical protein
MDAPVLYFDRCVGTAIPEALRLLGMKNVYHHHIHRAKAGLRPEAGQVSLFHHDTPDDEWMAFVGAKGWVVLSQDYSFHLEPAVLSVIKQHGAKVFYLWGADRPKWDAMRVFARQFDRIVKISGTTAGPFIYRVKARGAFENVPLGV